MDNQNASLEELLQRLLHEAKDHAIIVLDQDAVVVRWYPGVEEVFGYMAAEMVGRPSR
jgi:PAS domain S-box-containing protein